MDASRFDAWTRRRFGLAVGGVAAALFGLAERGEVAAKKRHKKKKRCRKLGDACTQGSKHKCCNGATCDLVGDGGVLQTFCCHENGGACTEDVECCQGNFCGVDGICRSFISDRALKANFGSVDPADMLARVRELPISTWNYTSDEPAIRHIGPMAQDFSAAFGVGADDRHIHPLDGQGIALAAIQGLADELARLQAENRALAARVATLEQAQDADPMT
jgi:hypothetical protein